MEGTHGAAHVLVPPCGDGLGLDDADDEEEGSPEKGVNVLDFLEVEDSAVHLLLVKAPQGVVVLLHRGAQHGKHGHSACRLRRREGTGRRACGETNEEGMKKGGGGEGVTYRV